MDQEREAAIAALTRAQRGLVTRAQLADGGSPPAPCGGGRPRAPSSHAGRAPSGWPAPRSIPAQRSSPHASTCPRLHLTAPPAWLHGHHPCPPRIDVTVPKGRSPGGRSVLDDWAVRVHSSTNLRVVDTVLVDGIPTTNLARTLLGVAALVPHEVPSDDLVEMVAGAIEARDASLRLAPVATGGTALSRTQRRHRTRSRPGRSRARRTDRQLARASHARPPPRGGTAATVAAATDPAPTDGVPARVDLLYERQRIVIEVLGYAFHRTPEQISADTMRANELQLQRFTVLQITSRTLREDEPNAAVEIVARALAQAATSPSGGHPSPDDLMHPRDRPAIAERTPRDLSTVVTRSDTPARSRDCTSQMHDLANRTSAAVAPTRSDTPRAHRCTISRTEPVPARRQAGPGTVLVAGRASAAREPRLRGRGRWRRGDGARRRRPRRGTGPRPA